MATATQLEKKSPATPLQPAWSNRITSLWTRAMIRWAEMMPSQRHWAIAAGALLGTLGVGMLWYALRPDWRTLYADLDPEDARQIGQILTQAQIPFEAQAGGSGILVQAAQLDKARLLTTAKGGVKSGRLGFEIFDKPNWVGSEFDEQVNYQRALEGELEHTVSSLSDIESARVHLVLPHDSLFRDQERPAKASVVIKPRHRSLADGEPEAIRNLIASAVDGLTPDRVALVDATGHLPLGPKTADAMRLSSEEMLEEKLISTLEPVTGEGNVRASVTLELNPSTSEETQETYDPDQTVTLSMQRTEQTSGAQPIAAGIPGSASNAPNTQTLPVYPQQSTPAQSSKTESGTYVASKTLRHMIESAGRVRRMTAAIVVNDRLGQPPAKGRAAVWQPRSAEELHDLTALAQAAVGFDLTRGDTLTVQDLPFDENRSLQPASLPRQVLETAEGSPVLVKCGALLIGVLMILAFGVRPAMSRSLSSQMEGAQTTARKLAVHAGSTATALEPPKVLELDPERTRNQDVFDRVAEHLKREPTQSSRLLQSWIHSD